MYTRLSLSLLVMIGITFTTRLHAQQASGDTDPVITADEQQSVRQARRKMLERPRGLIFNSDGCEVFRAKTPTPAAFLDDRLGHLRGSQVNTIMYCPLSSGFGLFTHRTKVGERCITQAKQLKGNITAELHAQGTDPLQIAVEFGHGEGMEVFFCMRMNDTHDVIHTAEDPDPLYPKWKMEHPEMLFGPIGAKMKHGRWSAVDFGQSEVRELAYRFLEEACRDYDIDGIELDFVRHPELFRRVGQTGDAATAEELGQMTDLMRRIRAMTEREAVRRGGRPYLLSIRLPDSVEACRWLGIDLERWLAEGLVDMLVPSGYFRFNPWSRSVELAHRHGVKVYADLAESRVLNEEKQRDPVRASEQSYRARAAQAWQAGADGAYIFNMYNARRPLLREIGDPNTLRQRDKIYFASVRGPYNAHGWFADSAKYFNRPTLVPDRPVKLAPGEKMELDVEFGEDAASLTGDPSPRITLRIRFLASVASPDFLQVQANGQALEGGQLAGDMLIFDLDRAVLKPGTNRFGLALGAGQRSTIRLRDLQIIVDYPQDGTAWPAASRYPNP